VVVALAAVDLIVAGITVDGVVAETTRQIVVTAEARR
jgi:hypothetical protein